MAKGFKVWLVIEEIDDNEDTFEDVQRDELGAFGSLEDAQEYCDTLMAVEPRAHNNNNHGGH